MNAMSSAMVPVCRGGSATIQSHAGVGFCQPAETLTQDANTVLPRPDPAIILYFLLILMADPVGHDGEVRKVPIFFCDGLEPEAFLAPRPGFRRSRIRGPITIPATPDSRQHRTIMRPGNFGRFIAATAWRVVTTVFEAILVRLVYFTSRLKLPSRFLTTCTITDDRHPPASRALDSGLACRAARRPRRPSRSWPGRQ
jgi:hypothetical protein